MQRAENSVAAAEDRNVAPPEIPFRCLEMVKRILRSACIFATMEAATFILLRPQTSENRSVRSLLQYANKGILLSLDSICLR